MKKQSRASIDFFRKEMDSIYLSLAIRGYTAEEIDFFREDTEEMLRLGHPFSEVVEYLERTTGIEFNTTKFS